MWSWDGQPFRRASVAALGSRPEVAEVAAQVCDRELWGVWRGRWPRPAPGGTSLTPPLLSPGCRWVQKRPRSWRQSGPGHLSCPSGWTCATGAERSRWLGRSSSECGHPVGPVGTHSAPGLGAGPGSAAQALTRPTERSSRALVGMVPTRGRTALPRGLWTFFEPPCYSLGGCSLLSALMVGHDDRRHEACLPRTGVRPGPLLQALCPGPPHDRPLVL